MIVKLVRKGKHETIAPSDAFNLENVKVNTSCLKRYLRILLSIIPLHTPLSPLPAPPTQWALPFS